MKRIEYKPNIILIGIFTFVWQLFTGLFLYIFFNSLNVFHIGNYITYIILLMVVLILVSPFFLLLRYAYRIVMEGHYLIISKTFQTKKYNLLESKHIKIINRNLIQRIELSYLKNGTEGKIVIYPYIFYIKWFKGTQIKFGLEKFMYELAEYIKKTLPNIEMEYIS